METDSTKNNPREDLIKRLLNNDISIEGLSELRKGITPTELSAIIQHIYDLNENYITKLSRVEATLGFLNRMKNEARQRHFFRKIKNGHRRVEGNKVILAEGDSWFNYPVILTDLIDRIVMEEDLALYSIAGGGDWLLNMLTASEYIEELSVIHPDVFLISGGGNDLVGARRLAAMVDKSGNSLELTRNPWAQQLIDKAIQHNLRQQHTPLNQADFQTGCRFISKDFFALLMFFHLQYSHMIGKILGPKGLAKFGPIKVVTQGYDYAIPSLERKWLQWPWNWYIPFIRRFLGHGGWLKVPLLMRGVPDECVVNGKTEKDIHRKIVYAMIYLFNEMMIELPTVLDGDVQLYHIDSRGFVGEDGWADELHARPAKNLKIGETFIKCIRGTSKPTYDRVFVVKSES